MTKPRLFPLFIFCVLTTVSNGAGCLAKTEKIVKTSNGAMAIAAVVNSHAISSFDVDNRIKFILSTTRISNTPDMLANIRPQIIRALIDESLQIQEAEKNNIKIDDAEVAQAITSIEAQRGMPTGGIANMLAANHIPEKTFNDQIRSGLAWNKLLSKNVRGRIKISDEDVTLSKGRTISTTPAEAIPVNIKEVEIAVISLPVEKREREAEMKKLSEKLSAELHKGASFEDVARQFSAGGNGQSFWINPQQLDSNIAQALMATKEGGITAPIRTHDGFSIIKLLHIRADKRTPKNKNEEHNVEVTLKEILLKLKSTDNNKDADILLQIGEAIAKNPGSCEEKGVASISALDGFDIEVNMRKAAASELPPALRSISESLKLGDMSTPFASAEGIRLYMLCGKKEIVGAPPLSADKIREGLFRQKFDLEAQKYLRDLRRGAFIDVRS